MSKNIFSDEYKEMIKLVENKDGSYSHSVFIQNEEEEEEIIHKEFTKLVFGGNENLIINDDAEYRSQLIDVSEYKDIEIIVNQGVRADVDVRFTLYTPGNNEELIAIFYDWNTDSWALSHYGRDTTITLPRYKAHLYLLSTHPSCYWLKDLSFDRMRVRIKAQETPQEADDNIFNAWVVGDVVV